MDTTGDKHTVDLSMITVNWNTKDLLLNCIESAYTTIKKRSFEYIVVDNGSTDGSVDALSARYPDVLLIKNTLNVGYTKAVNQGLQAVRGRYVVMLNSDAVLTEGAVETLADFLDSHPEAGMAGGQLLNRDGSKQNSFGTFPSFLTELTNKSLLKLLLPNKYMNKHAGHEIPLQVDQVIGACMIVRREMIEKVGLLDERFFLFFEETDWAWRIHKSGWKIFHVPSARIYHLQGQSAKQNLSRARVEYFRSRYKYFEKHFGKRGYLLLFWGMLLKLAADFLMNTAGTLATLGFSQSIRERTCIYGYLLWWHLQGCPEHMGLKDRR